MSGRGASKFAEIASRWVDDAYETKPSSIPKVVYHYTDAAGLLGMLRNGRIWATDYRFLNDKSEVEHTRKGVRRLVSGKLSPSGDEGASKLLAEILSYQDIEPTTDSYVFSLSEEADDLSQWRAYARDGQGFTIGFCGSSLHDFAQGGDGTYAFVKVEYDHARQDDAVDRAIDDFLKELQLQSGRPKARIARVTDQAASWFDWMVESRAVANKHRSFHLEKEWRIVGTVPKEDDKREVKVRSSGLRLVRYIELCLGDQEQPRLPIKRIGIGPGFVGNEEVHAVKALCKETGYEPEYYFADTPYRRL